MASSSSSTSSSLIYISFSSAHKLLLRPFFHRLTMWDDLPFDLLANILSFLPLDSLARARSVCRHWHACASTHPSTTTTSRRHPPWFIALPLRAHRPCYAHNPTVNVWHELSMDFVPEPVKPIAPMGNLLLLRSSFSTSLRLAVCNPFTKQFKYLPKPTLPRTNPAVGVVVLGSPTNVRFPHFRIYVAGGTLEAPHGGATYEPTLEMYDSETKTWQVVGSMPVEFAVRLTVWTPNESVFCNGVLYWMTSARAYSVMCFDTGSKTCKELHAPMADRLEFAAITMWKGRVSLVGGICGGEACMWELGGREKWSLVEKVPSELGMKLMGCKRSWASTKCVGNEEAVCLYGEIGGGMVVRRRGGGEWIWVDGWCSVGGKKVQNLGVKGVLIHPTLSPFDELYY